jgi:hypothetical protein
MKRLTILAVALTILAGGGATQAFGAALFSMSPDTQTVAGDSVFSRYFLVSGNTSPIFDWQVSLFYDTTLVSPTATATEGSFLKKHGITYFVGPVWAGWNDLAFTCTFLGGGQWSQDTAGTLATITFTAKNKPGTNSTAMTFDRSDDDNFLDDTTLSDVPLGFKDGLVTVTGATGVEGNSPVTVQKLEVRPTPNPFASFATIPGYEAQRFALYDLSGRLVGIYRGDRIGEGLPAGVYFLREFGRDSKPLRIVKVR